MRQKRYIANPIKALYRESQDNDRLNPEDIGMVAGDETLIIPFVAQESYQSVPSFESLVEADAFLENLRKAA